MMVFVPKYDLRVPVYLQVRNGLNYFTHTYNILRIHTLKIFTCVTEPCNWLFHLMCYVRKEYFHWSSEMRTKQSKHWSFFALQLSSL